MKRRLLVVITIIAMLSMTVLVGCNTGGGGSSSTPPPATSGDGGSAAVDTDKESIVIGGVRSQSGVYAMFDATSFGPIYRMWVEQVNADGGIYVEEYGKKLPIELLIYDDKSDTATMSRLYEKLCVEDKVDLLLPPVSTAALYAAAPLTARYGYLLMGAEGGSASLKEQIDTCPDFFSIINYSENQVPATIEVFKEIGVKSMYIVYIEDLFGTEYLEATKEAIKGTDIQILGEKAVPPDTTDYTAIINDAKASGAQCFATYCYPDQNIPCINQAYAMGYDPEVYLIGPGITYDFFQHVLAIEGASPTETVEGLMGFGAWNAKCGPGAKAFREMFVDFYGPNGQNVLNNPDAGDKNLDQDWWGHIQYQVFVEVLQQAIEGAGTLDNKKLSEYIKTHHFDTSMGDVWFENNFIAPECYVGNIGQWQNGIFEVIDVGEKRTADPIAVHHWPKP